MTEIAQQAPPRRSILKHWMLRLLVAGATLLIVIIVVVQIVLGTQIPREIVIAQVQRTLGLRVTAEQFSTGWFGHTTLRNVVVSLPLAEHAFLEIPDLRVDHTVLPVLLITQSLDIKSIALDKPKIYVTQGPDGRWNLQDVAALLAKIGGTGQPDTGQSSTPISLPQMDLHGGEIILKDRTGRQVSITPFNVIGKPVNALVWQYDATCNTDSGARISLAGRVAPGDNFSHEVNFSLSNLQSLAQPWITGFDPAAELVGDWRGTKTSDGIAGRLLLKSFKYETVSAQQGDVSITASGTAVSANAPKLIVQMGEKKLESFVLTGGSVSVDAINARAKAIELTALNGRVLVNGSFGFADQSGDLHAEWKTLQPTPAISSSGFLDATLRSNWPDQRSLKVDLSTSGEAAENDYNAHLVLSGGGKAWDAASWMLTAPTLQLSGKHALALDHVVARVVTKPGEIDLTDLTLPASSSVAGAGGLRYDPQHPLASNYNWWLYLQGQNWILPKTSGAALAFGVNAWGDQQQIRLQQVFGIVDRIYAGLEGYYRMPRPKPVDLNLNICELPASPGGATDLIQGKLRGEGVLAGTIVPMSLEAKGQLHGEQIMLGDRPLQQIDVKCSATLQDKVFAFDTEELSLLGGRWSVHGQIPARESVHGNAPDVTLRVHDLPLANVADLLHQKDVAGLAAGSLELVIDDTSLRQIAAKGKFLATNVRAKQLKADTVAANVSLRDGLLKVVPIDLQFSTGHAHASLSTTLKNPQLLTASFDASDWPVDAGPVHATVSANTEGIEIDAKRQAANGQLAFGASAQLRDRPLLTANASIVLGGRTVNLENFTAKVLDGNASGSAMVDIDHPLASRGAFRWDTLDLDELSSYDSVYQTATGFLTGRADLAPSTDPRALGPLTLDIASVGQGTKFRTVSFNDIHLPIFVDTDRLVLSGGKVDVAGGSVSLFGRMSRHAENTVSTLLEAQLDGLDLEELIHATDQSDADKLKAYPGKLAGTISLVGDPRDKLQLFGRASLQIHQSDLGSFGPFAVLYDTMHFGGTAGKRIGEGTVEARYDNDSLIVSSLRYFNRGIDAYGLATIKDISRYPNSGLSGELVGTYSPLKNIKLPFFADADKIFSVLQSNLTSIVIGGTIAKPSYVPESASVIGSAMRTFLLGDVSERK